MSGGTRDPFQQAIAATSLDNLAKGPVAVPIQAIMCRAGQGKGRTDVGFDGSDPIKLATVAASTL